MKKLENFSKSLEILKSADFNLVNDSEIYRMGVIGQFNLTFELAWKALQEVMRRHAVGGAETGSPNEILKLAYKVGLLSDSTVWLAMLRQRSISVHIYDEDKIEEMILMIRDSFIPAFSVLEKTLQDKLTEVDNWD